MATAKIDLGFDLLESARRLKIDCVQCKGPGQSKVAEDLRCEEHRQRNLEPEVAADRAGSAIARGEWGLASLAGQSVELATLARVRRPE